VISDVLDNRLDFCGHVQVTVESKDGTIVAATLAEGEDYVLSVTDNDSLGEGKPSDSFTVGLTPNGMKRLSNVPSADVPHIRVRYNARINANARAGEQIPNQANLDYVNSLGIHFHQASDIPKVYTGGVWLKKVDADNNEVTLQGAEFKLYRKATPAEVVDETIEKVSLAGFEEPMVAVWFCLRTAWWRLHQHLRPRLSLLCPRMSHPLRLRRLCLRRGL